MQAFARKQVRFNEASNTALQSAYTVEESRDSWYDRNEMKRFHYEVRKTALAIQFKRSSIEKPMSYGNVFRRVYSGCMENKLPSTSLFRYFVQWRRSCPEREGIERYCVRNLDAEVRRRASESIVLVLALQTQLVLDRASSSTRAARLACEYQQEVQPARIFARIKGIAGAAVVKQEAQSMQSGKRRLVETPSSPSSIPNELPMRLPLKKRKLGNKETIAFAIKAYQTAQANSPPRSPMIKA